jgi:hypothetical protein
LRNRVADDLDPAEDPWLAHRVALAGSTVLTLTPSCDAISLLL